MSAVLRYGIGPGGLKETTFTHRARLQLKGQLKQFTPGERAAQTWAGMPIGQRFALVFYAFGPLRVAEELHLKAWGELEPRDRIVIGVKARQQAQALL